MLALKELIRRRLQFSLIALVITLIAYLILMINGLGVGLNQLAGSPLWKLGGNAIAYAEEAEISIIRSELSIEALNALKNQPEIDHVAALGYLAVNIGGEAEGTNLRSAALLSLNLDEQTTIEMPKIIAGRTLQSDNPEILASTEFLKDSGLSIGDEVLIQIRLGEWPFTIVGEVEAGMFFFQPTIFVDQLIWQDLKYGERVATTPIASVVLLSADNFEKLQIEGIDIVSKKEAFANIEGVAGQQSTVAALRVFGYLIGALVVGAFFYVLTLQKEAQLGVLKAIGASSTYLFFQVMTQTILISLIGIAVSVPLAWGTAEGLSKLPTRVPVAFEVETFVTTSIILVVMGIIGSLLSGSRIARVDPIIALGQQQ